MDRHGAKISRYGQSKVFVNVFNIKIYPYGDHFEAWSIILLNFIGQDASSYMPNYAVRILICCLNCMKMNQKFNL